MKRLFISFFFTLFLFVCKSQQITYTPQTAAGYQFKYIKVDSGFAVTFRDTIVGRGAKRPGLIVCRPQDSLFYGYNGAKWQRLGDSSGVGVISKVDSVTISAGVLYYWINGVAVGTDLPSGLNQNLDAVTTNGNSTANNIQVGNVTADLGLITWQQTNLDYLIETKTQDPSTDTFFRGQIKGDSITGNHKWYLPDTTGLFVTSVNGFKPNKKGQVSFIYSSSGGADSTIFYTNYRADTSRTNIYGQINLTNAQTTANTNAIVQRPTYTQLTDSLNSLQFDLPLTYSGRTITSTQSSALNDGYLSAADFQKFDTSLSRWNLSSTNIYNNNAGNVGIGTISPLKKLDVNGDALINGLTVGIGGTGANFNNVVIGRGALLLSTATALSNIAIGANAGAALTTGLGNVILGHNALLTGVTAEGVVAVGSGAMQNFTGGVSYNTAIGYNAMNTAATGINNVAIGRSAMTSVSGTLSGGSNTVIGTSSGDITTGSNNLILGSFISQTDPTASNQLVIGGNGVKWIEGNGGNIAIGGVPTANKLEVYGNTNIQGTVTATNIKSRKYNELFTGSTSLVLTLANNYVSNNILLFKNGVLLTPTTDYTETAANQITLVVSRITDDLISLQYEY